MFSIASSFSKASSKNPDPPQPALNILSKGRFSLAISPEILTELHDVLSRSHLRQSFPRLTEEKLEQLIDLLLLKGKLFRNVPRVFDLPRDPDDEPYINLAIEAGARFLVTRDRDLLDLMNWETKEGRGFQSRFAQLKILNPVDFLRMLEAE